MWDLADKQDGAYADVTVKLGLIKLLQKQFDICEEAYVLLYFCRGEANEISANANSTVQCPVKPANYKISQTVELPKEIPKGKTWR